MKALVVVGVLVLLTTLLFAFLGRLPLVAPLVVGGNVLPDERLQELVGP